MIFAWNGQEWAPSQGSWPRLADRLQVVTWNLWFDAHLRSQRCAAISLELEQLRPQLLGFQEATLAMLRPFFDQPWLQKEYWCTASPTSAPDSHGVVLWGRVQLEHLKRLLLPGSMGRRALICHTGRLQLGVVHLESLTSQQAVRRQQLEQLWPELHTAPAALLMGDLNFCATSNENEQIPPDFQDAWTQLHPQDPGWTLDSQRNPLLRAHRPARYDRMLARGLCIESIQLVGTEGLKSDHYGLALQARLTS